MTAKPTQLSSSLVVRKGQAAPPPSQPVAPAGELLLPADAKTVTALTVKLDDARYRRLKSLGMRRPRRSNQTMMVAALDAYLAAQGA